MELSIRSARTEDTSAVRKFVLSTLSELGIKTLARKVYRDLFDLKNAYSRQNGEFFIVEENDQTIGTIGVFGIDRDLAQIRRYYVDSKFRGKGIGRKLLKCVFAFCKKRKYNAIIAVTEIELKRAYEVYLKAGFEPFRQTPRVNYLVKYLGRKTKKLSAKVEETYWINDWDGKIWKKRAK
ncbi:GNAT family N-acetyltransferase [Candidatus Micrarchaeota archaeon]|nr:GNAT family N-acetyltransferase [Candidatus Micrarchaeota archaeon]